MAQYELPSWFTQDFCKDRYSYSDGNLYLLKPYKGIDNFKVGGKPDKNGYLRVVIFHKEGPIKVMLHRIIFLYHHGYLPEIVDHMDQDITNNRIENLREANKNQNQWNRKVVINSQTGIRGVIFKNGKIYAQCKVNGIRTYLGQFETVELAEEALKEFRLTHHKEFASYER